MTAAGRNDGLSASANDAEARRIRTAPLSWVRPNSWRPARGDPYAQADCCYAVANLIKNSCTATGGVSRLGSTTVPTTVPTSPLIAATMYRLTSLCLVTGFYEAADDQSEKLSCCSQHERD